MVGDKVVKIDDGVSSAETSETNSKSENSSTDEVSVKILTVVESSPVLILMTSSALVEV